MPFSHHSHSGQFCGHAQDTLKKVVQTAIEKRMQVFALTEHMPREEEDFYPEESEMHTTATLSELFADYYQEALRLQTLYASNIQLLVGMEVDWIRPSSDKFIHALLDRYQLDLFIGSVHHVHTIPIDFDRDMYLKARGMAGGTDERLFEDYFDLQLEMLRALKPPIVGHFDLIRLLSDDRNASLSRWDGVWQKILTNLDFIAAYGGVIELNSAALRKGMSEPYPQIDICKAFITRGGQFTMSDDSHGINHIGTNYARLLGFIEDNEISPITIFERASHARDSRFRGVSMKTVSLAEIKNHPFFA